MGSAPHLLARPPPRAKGQGAGLSLSSGAGQRSTLSCTLCPVKPNLPTAPPVSNPATPSLRLARVNPEFGGGVTRGACPSCCRRDPTQGFGSWRTLTLPLPLPRNPSTTPDGAAIASTQTWGSPEPPVHPSHPSRCGLTRGRVYSGVRAQGPPEVRLWKEGRPEALWDRPRLGCAQTRAAGLSPKPRVRVRVRVNPSGLSLTLTRARGSARSRTVDPASGIPEG